MDADPPPVAHGPRPVEIEVVRGALTRLSLLAQTLSGALDGDPERYAETFAETLGEPLRSGAARVVCVIREGAVCYAGTEVSGNDLVIKSIVSRLADEGVASITLLPGIQREELIELCHLLGRPAEVESEVDAVATLGARAWSLGLEHVHFETTATRLVNEADDAVRPVELVRRLAMQLGLDEETLELDAHLELAAVLGGLRALADAPRAAGVDRPPTGSVWGRALRALHQGNDVPPTDLSMLVTESLRAAGLEAEVESTARTWLDRARRAFADGDPVLAGRLLRPVVLAADPRFRPRGIDTSPIRAALGAFFGSDTRKAIQAGLKQHPGTDDWVGVLFTLGAAATEDTLLDLAAIGRGLEAGAVREALGDAVATAADRLEGMDIRSLLARASDDTLPVLLQAARRFSDPTLIEPLLARTRHDDPVVREAALLALRAQQSPRIKAAAREAVSDRARAVRMEALRYVSVYRDTDTAPIVAERLQSVGPADADLDELRALAIAWLHTSRGTALAELEATAARTDARHPHLAAACVAALARAGGHGRQALDRLGRTRPELRPVIREHSAPRGQESRS